MWGVSLHEVKICFKNEACVHRWIIPNNMHSESTWDEISLQTYFNDTIYWYIAQRQTSPERRSPKPHPESQDLQTTTLTPSLPAPVLFPLHPPDLLIGRGWNLSFSVSGIFIFLLAMSQLVIGSKGSAGAAGDLHIFFAKVWNTKETY